MKNTPLVSILLPCYNSAPFIARAVESVLNQTMGDFELLILDDASTDLTRYELKKFSDPRIQIISNTKNQGVSATLNQGLRLVRGEFIAVIASDDFWLPQKLERQITFFQNYNFDILGTWIQEVPENSEAHKLIHKFEIKEDPLTHFLTHQQVGLGPSLIARNTAKSVRLDEALRVNEDWECFARMAVEGFRFGVVPEILTICYRRNLGLSKIESNAASAKMALSRFNSLVKSGRLKKETMALSYMRSAMWLLNPEQPKFRDSWVLVVNSLRYGLTPKAAKKMASWVHVCFTLIIRFWIQKNIHKFGQLRKRAQI